MKKCILLILFFFVQLWAFAWNGSPLANQDLVFIENRGQVRDKDGNIRKDIQFVLQSSTMSLFVGKDGLHYQFMKRIMPDIDTTSDKKLHQQSFVRAGSPSNITVSRLDVFLLGSNNNSVAVKEEAQESYYNYYGASSENESITHVRSYKKLIYKNIYPNIDWVLYTTGQTLKYDFIVHPGGKIRDIKMKYEGAEQISLEENGNIQITTLSGVLQEQAPYSYEMESKKKVASKYTLKNNTVCFDAGSYEGTLIIDPALEWGTYVKSIGIAEMKTIIDGYFYVSGVTSSVSNIATAGSHQDTFAGGYSDAVLAKYDTFGRLQWATYYSGAGDGKPRSLVGQELFVAATANEFGHVYLCGATTSKDGIATPGSFQSSFYSDTTTSVSLNGFLAQFTAGGIRTWATYYGRGNTRFVDVACDNKGNVYACGSSTDTTTYLVTAGTHQTINAGGRRSNTDGILVKFDSLGRRLWATFYGGEGDWEDISKVVCDTEANVYIAGLTNSTTGIASSEAFQDSLHAGNTGYIAKMNGENGQRVWGTHVDGLIYGLVVDRFSHLYAGGVADDFWHERNIATPGTYMSERQGNIFLLQFNPSSGARNWGTFYGTKEKNTRESGGIVACDIYGHVYMAGVTNAFASSSGTYTIATPGSHQDTLNTTETINPKSDAFVVQFDSTGRRKWATYYGGPESESSSGLVCDESGALYMSGSTNSDANIATDAGLNRLREGSSSFLVRFQPVDIVLKDILRPEMDTVCTGQVPFEVAVANNGRMNKIDTLEIGYTYTGPGNGSGEARFGNGLAKGVTDTFPLDLNFALPGAYDLTVWLRYTRDDNAPGNDTQTFHLVAIEATPVAEIDAYNIGSVFHFRNSNPKAVDRYHWNFGDGTTSEEAEPTHQYSVTDSYIVTLIITNICGSDTATLRVEGIGSNSIETIELEKSLSIYPNPANGYLYFAPKHELKLYRYTIDNILGQTLYERVWKGENQIDVNELLPGSYFLNVYSDMGRITRKLQIVR